MGAHSSPPRSGVHRAVRFLFTTMMQKKKTQREVCFLAGLDRRTILYWNRGHSPSIDNIEATLNVLGYELQVVKKGRP